MTDQIVDIVDQSLRFSLFGFLVTFLILLGCHFLVN